jgi:hypothetical protein
MELHGMMLIRHMTVVYHATQESLITGHQWKPLSAAHAMVICPALGLQNTPNLLSQPVCSAMWSAIRSPLA